MDSYKKINKLQSLAYLVSKPDAYDGKVMQILKDAQEGVTSRVDGDLRVAAGDAMIAAVDRVVAEVQAICRGSSAAAK